MGRNKKPTSKKNITKEPKGLRKTTKKPHGLKKTHKKRKKIVKVKSELDPDVRRCIVNEIASAKGTRRMTKGDKRALFDAALRKCVRKRG